MSLNTYKKILETVQNNINKIDTELLQVAKEIDEIQQCQSVYFEIDAARLDSFTGNILNSRLQKKYNLEMVRNKYTKAIESIQNLLNSLQEHNEKVTLLLTGILKLGADSEKRAYSRLAKNPHMVTDIRLYKILSENRLSDFQKKVMLEFMLSDYQLDPFVFDFID